MNNKCIVCGVDYSGGLFVKTGEFHDQRAVQDRLASIESIKNLLSLIHQQRLLQKQRLYRLKHRPPQLAGQNKKRDDLEQVLSITTGTFCLYYCKHDTPFPQIPAVTLQTYEICGRQHHLLASLGNNTIVFIYTTSNKVGNLRINVKIRRLHVTIVTAEKQ